ncbi:hypothetical protein IV203_021401 [Nitzschia inconspicua]|uniref:Uncharacterized protein n=1 Tax=Nitzschia inconspicua TaxID=303405 RepID=A0A9K3KHS0_9STRA|nr:hypothetical protein IV203_021401 [Nitzschia inconspicua]
MPKAAKRIINQSAAGVGTPSKFQRILRAVTFLPLTILLLERLWIPLEGPISGYLNVELVASTTTLKTKMNTASSSSSNSSVMTVTTVAETYPLKRIVQRSSFGNFGTTTCPNGIQLIQSKILDTSTTKTKTTIKYFPNTVHLAIERSCVTPETYKWYQQWLSPDTIDWSTYLYDSPTQRRILRLGAALLHSEFPQLKQIVRHCMSRDDNDRTIQQLWKYLVLYIYGGIYVTPEYEPASTLVASLLPIDDTAVLLMDVNSNNHDDPGFILSSPGHPLLYLALHHAMRDVILGPSSFFDRRDDISPIHRAIMNFSILDDVSSQPNNSNNNNDTVLVEMNNSKVLILNGNTFNPYAYRLATNRVGSLSTTQRPAASLSFCREKILTHIFYAETNERI